MFEPNRQDVGSCVRRSRELREERVVRERSLGVGDSGGGAVSGEDRYQMVHGHAMNNDKMETIQMPQIRVR